MTITLKGKVQVHNTSIPTCPRYHGDDRKNNQRDRTFARITAVGVKRIDKQIMEELRGGICCERKTHVEDDEEPAQLSTSSGQDVERMEGVRLKMIEF